ncbi:MarR family winged helix-turn-helix transcriptional regulator [Paenibacillus silviterrae]|uniref:MarR family winged helix-turn-helix transcriptional regulator n=1 Tax=Paenibacillus silviterrae TaxID=3242194 RepID=UPI002542A9A4|nr:MarR family transcriptional regulator [Paenibacillus chinjuensis]
MSSPIDPKQLCSVREFILFIGQKLKKCTQAFESNCDLNRHEASILLLLHQRGPLVVKEIAGQMQDISPSTLTRLLDSLEEKRFIRRNLDPGDRRSFVITLTEEAREVMESFPKHMETLAGAMLESLTPAERMILLELFNKMEKHMENP